MRLPGVPLRMARVLLLAALAAALLLAGCTITNSTSGQGASSEGGKGFAKAGNHGGATKTETASWQNDGSKARGQFVVNQGSGSVTLAIKDAGGATVWTWTGTSVGQTADAFTTSSGSPGTWTLTVTLVGFSGQYSVEGRSA